MNWASLNSPNWLTLMSSIHHSLLVHCILRDLVYSQIILDLGCDLFRQRKGVAVVGLHAVFTTTTTLFKSFQIFYLFHCKFYFVYFLGVRFCLHSWLPYSVIDTAICFIYSIVHFRRAAFSKDPISSAQPGVPSVQFPAHLVEWRLFSSIPFPWQHSSGCFQLGTLRITWCRSDRMVVWWRSSRANIRCIVSSDDWPVGQPLDACPVIRHQNEHYTIQLWGTIFWYFEI